MREEIKDRYGFSKETIEAAGIGYAPIENKLRKYLKGRGYSDLEILSSGLFAKNLEPLWRGRIVFPYFVDGRPRYFTSRRTEDTCDKLQGKYAKQARNPNYISEEVNEPIFGVDTAVDDEPLIITEGVTDAIAAHQHGYPCIAPVTTRFKRVDRDRLLVHAKRASKVYIIMDAEESGVGLEGAVDTGVFLEDNGIDAYIVELPRPVDRSKIDLCEFLNGLVYGPSRNLEPYLDSAKPPKEHRIYRKKIEAQRSVEKAVKEESKGLGININIPITDVIPISHMQKRGNHEFQGSPPPNWPHGSETGWNFAVNTKLNAWFCFREGHWSGGGPLLAIAVREGLINCSEARTGALRGEKFVEILNAAKKQGFDVDNAYKKNLSKKPSLILPFECYEESDTIRIPDTRYVILKGPPRSGKTHEVIKHLLERFQKKGETANLITHRHSICQHHINLLEKLSKGAESPRTVYLQGKNKCCPRSGNCSSCLLKPHEGSEDNVGYFETREKGWELLREKVILKPSDVPENYCPYYTLKFVEPDADFCITVKELFDSIKTRNNLLIDEEPTLDYFHPRSAKILELRRVHDRIQYADVPPLLREWEVIESARDELREKQRKNEIDLDILQVIRTLEEIRAELGLNSVISRSLESEHRITLSATLKEYEKVLGKITWPKLKSNPEELIKKIRRLFLRYQQGDNGDAAKILEAASFVHPNFGMYWERSQGSDRHKLFIVADEDRQFFADQLAGYRRVIIIGGTRAEKFVSDLIGSSENVKSLNPNVDVTVLKVDKFKYRDNFVILPVDGGNRGDCKRKIIETINYLVEDGVPTLIITGSKREQRRATYSISRKSFPARRNDKPKDLEREWIAENACVFYQNSIISRGIDIPFFDVIVVYSADFSTPYWEAKAYHSKLEEKKKREEGGEVLGEDFKLSDLEGDREAQHIIHELKIQETTNSALRITPTPSDDELQPKFLIVPRHELASIRYIGRDQILPRGGGRDLSPKKISSLIFPFARRAVKSLSISDWAKQSGEPKLLQLHLGQEKARTAVKESALLSYLERAKLGSLDLQKIDPKVVKGIERAVVKILKSSNSRLSRGILVDRVKDEIKYRKNSVIGAVLRKMRSEDKIRVEREGRRRMYSLAEIDENQRTILRFSNVG